jgi:hypothetical protein
MVMPFWWTFLLRHRNQASAGFFGSKSHCTHGLNGWFSVKMATSSFAAIAATRANSLMKSSRRRCVETFEWLGVWFGVGAETAQLAPAGQTEAMCETCRY